MRVLNLAGDSDGGSRFVELEIPQTKIHYAENVPPLLVSDEIAATGVVFVTMPADVRDTNPHPAPRRQLVVMLEGEFEVEATDGEKRNLTPGTLALLEDVEGLGHKTTVRSTGPATFLAIPLAD